jgi:hypothetical protein
MKTNRFASIVLFAASFTVALAADKEFRPPAVPLVACDPYFSIWSMDDHLWGDVTRHWTGAPHSMASMAHIDGTAYRIMGQGDMRPGRQQTTMPVMEQKSVQVLPTRTIYTFESVGVALTLTFMTPTLPHNLDLLARPVTYVTWSVKATDGKAHSVSLYFDATAQIAVNTLDQKVIASRYKVGDLSALRVGTVDQPVLGRNGDWLRIDWGYLYATTDSKSGAQSVIASTRTTRGAFARSGSIPNSDDLAGAQPAGEYRGAELAPTDSGPALAFGFDLGQVSAEPISRYVVLAYDDLYSVQFLYRQLRPYWRRRGLDMRQLLETSVREYTALRQQCEMFDAELMADLRKAGGEEYATLAALAFRQAFAAQKIVADHDGRPLQFSKENSSNGCVGTVDVIYPTIPLMLVFNPELVKASLTPVFEFSGSSRWVYPWAPHDLGVYPFANGRDTTAPADGVFRPNWAMAVEESANMILMAAALARIEGNANYAAQNWALLTKWAEYVKKDGLDPIDQGVTDDFTSHLQHNANLSVKAICSLGGYALMCDMLGKKQEAESYRQTAKEYAQEWLRRANDGDHYRLAFDQEGSWSQKYNLVWDKILDLKLFPADVPRKEIAYYLKHQNDYGLPLDGRDRFTKLDWLVWTATLAEKPDDFEALIKPACRWADESPDRQPLGDLYYTHSGRRRGFQARSVVGGVFIKLMADPTLWGKWANRATQPSAR